MSYDRDSFLAGLAVGRTLWRPHRDYGGEVTEYNVIDLSEYMQGSHRYTNMTLSGDAYKGGTAPHYASFYYRANSTGYIAYCAGGSGWDGGNSASMFDVFIPARFRRVLVDVQINTADWSRNMSAIDLCDSMGVRSYLDTTEGTAFTGSVLRKCYFTSSDKTAEQINSQPYVSIVSNDPAVLSRQTVVIDISDISSDMYVGLQRIGCEMSVYSIIAK